RPSTCSRCARRRASPRSSATASVRPSPRAREGTRNRSGEVEARGGAGGTDGGAGGIEFRRRWDETGALVEAAFVALRQQQRMRRAQRRGGGGRQSAGMLQRLEQARGVARREQGRHGRGEFE